MNLLIEMLYYGYVVLLSLIFFGLLAISIGNHGREEELNTGFYPGVLVIIPCRGIDFSLKENILSIMDQEYGNFECVAVVDELDDPAVQVLKDSGIKIVVSDFSCTGCSGKVRAIATAFSNLREYDAYVIADSDIYVDRKWLQHLVLPLGDKNIGLVTAFPYFKPVGGFWSKVKLVWGFVGLGMMESKVTRFGWGGSLAFRKELLSSDESMKQFSSSVSDDIAITRLAKSSGKRIYYSRLAQPVIRSPDDFRTFKEWSNRQTALSESSSPRVFQIGALIFGSTCLIFVSSIVLSLLISPIFLLFLIPLLVSAAKNTARSREMKATVFSLSFLVPFIYLYNLIAGRRMRMITWRGKEYEVR